MQGTHPHRRATTSPPFATPRASAQPISRARTSSTRPRAPARRSRSSTRTTIRTPRATSRSTARSTACRRARRRTAASRSSTRTAQTSPLPGNAPAGDDWTVEAALDLDMASAACPNCKLILVEAQDDQGDGLLQSRTTRAAALGATVISNIWGGPADGTERVSYETVLQPPRRRDLRRVGRQRQHRRDAGLSEHVGARRPRSAARASSSRRNARGWTEGAWSERRQLVQRRTSPSRAIRRSTACAKRAAADVVGGRRSEHRPRGLQRGARWLDRRRRHERGVAVRRRRLRAVRPRAQTPGLRRTQHASKFFDVTTGKNGSCGTILCNAGAGWDGPTGIGTPNGTRRSAAAATLHADSAAARPAATTAAAAACGTCGTGADAAGSGGGSGCSGGGGGTCAHPICSTGGELDGTLRHLRGQDLRGRLVLLHHRVGLDLRRRGRVGVRRVVHGGGGGGGGGAVVAGWRRQHLRPRDLQRGRQADRQVRRCAGADLRRRTRTAATPSGTRSASARSPRSAASPVTDGNPGMLVTCCLAS